MTETLNELMPAKIVVPIEKAQLTEHKEITMAKPSTNDIIRAARDSGLTNDTRSQFSAAAHDARNDMQWSGWVPADRGSKPYSDGSTWNSKNSGDLMARCIIGVFGWKK